MRLTDLNAKYNAISHSKNIGQNNYLKSKYVQQNFHHDQKFYEQISEDKTANWEKHLQ